MNDTTNKKSTVGSLFRVNYSYIANNGAIRSGSIAVVANTTEEAKSKGSELLATFKINNPKVSGARPY